MNSMKVLWFECTAPGRYQGDDAILGGWQMGSCRNNLPNILLDASCNLCLMDDTIVCHISSLITTEKDSRKGDYCLEYDIPPFLLNSGRYYFKYWFGESQAYVIWGDYIHVFDVADAITLEGYNMATPPGVIRPKFDYQTKFLG